MIPAAHITVAEAARRAGASKTTVRDACRTGKLAGVLVEVPGQPRPVWYVSEAALENWKPMVSKRRTPMRELVAEILTGRKVVKAGTEHEWVVRVEREQMPYNSRPHWVATHICDNVADEYKEFKTEKAALEYAKVFGRKQDDQSRP